MDFYKRINIICKKIPYGKVASYGQIALLCGKAKNSRQVGYALRTGRNSVFDNGYVQIFRKNKRGCPDDVGNLVAL